MVAFAAVQHLATNGFLGGSEARPEAPLDRATAGHRARTATLLIDGRADPTDRARSRPEAGDDPMTAATVRDRLSAGLDRAEVDVDVESAFDAVEIPAGGELTRGSACDVLHQ